MCGRIGRSAAGKSLDEEAIRLAITAHVRHTETRYDELLAKGYERCESREQVEEEVLQVLAKWERRSIPSPVDENRIGDHRSLPHQPCRER
jgi:hypothetical protein